MLREEVYARALRASQNVRESGGIGGRVMRLVGGRGVGECGSGRRRTPRRLIASQRK